MTNKKVMYAVGAIVTLGVLYLLMKKKNDGTTSEKEELPTSSSASDFRLIESGQDFTSGGDYYRMIDGKKYKFIQSSIGENANPQLDITKEHLDSIPSGGIIGNDNRPVNQ